jgi:rhodanese-related sulfurtransferase
MKFNLALAAVLLVPPEQVRAFAPMSRNKANSQFSQLSMTDMPLPPVNSGTPVILQRNKNGQFKEIRYLNFVQLAIAKKVNIATFSGEGTQLLGLDPVGASLKIQALPAQNSGDGLEEWARRLSIPVVFFAGLVLFSLRSLYHYVSRIKRTDFASNEAILAALQQPGTIVLDVRTQEEIANDGCLENQTRFPNLTYKQSDCTVLDCEKLRLSPGEVIPNITTSTATIVIHCKSGLRATRAKALLLEHGYEGLILNAGGYTDIQRFF